MPLTKYGWPQVVVLPILVLLGMVVLVPAPMPLWAVISIEAVLAVVLIWVLAFFRDPNRKIPVDSDFLLAPADGRITDIETVQEDDFIKGPTLRIGIFLSIFDVHINRAPCSAMVEKIFYKKGRYKDARDPQAGRLNESNDLYLVRADAPNDRLIVRQISGAIARRIVCSVGQGQKLSGGQKFGMIKFGSRTELYLPIREDVKCLVRTGDKVKAGLTPVVRYER
jgi:phosphatidylserine decarboxylase